MSRLEIALVPCLSDNYAYLVRDESTGTTAVIDPSEEDPVLAALAERDWQLDYILNTHHHWDHTGGNPALKKATACQIVGAQVDEARIPGIDIAVAADESFLLGDASAEILFIPGHTSGHIAFYFPESQAVFSGDTLFTLGCGRVFEGTFEEMWASLDQLRQLPADTEVYCGHEYTLRNAEFALSVEPENQALQERYRAAQEQNRRGQPSVPASLAAEKASNPFLRPESPEIRASLGLADASDVEVFTTLRQLKDRY